MHLSKYIFLGTVLFSVSGFALLPASAQAQSLSVAVQETLSTHPSIEAAIATLDATKEQRNEAHSRYFPQVALNSSFGRMYGDNATSRGLSVTRGAGYSYLGEGLVTVSQLIFDGLETPSRVDAAEARSKSASEDVLDVQEALAFRAAQTYIDVVRAAKALALIDGHVEKVEDYTGRIGSMVDDGASDETELQQARDINVILQGIRAEYRGQFQAASARYKEVTGSDVPDTMEEPPSVAPHISDNIDQALSTASAIHPAIVAARLREEASGYDVMAEKGTLYPDVNGELSYLKSDKDDIIGGEVTDARALVRMSWNFSTGGEQYARLKRSKYAHKESRARMQELKRQIEQGVKLAYVEYHTAKTQLELLQERHELNGTLFGAYESQFEGARVNLLQLMQAHNQVFNTELESLNGQYRYLAAQYGVLASMGQLQNNLGLQTASMKVSEQAHGQK